MSKVIENYILQEVVGSGQYGKVYKARNMKNDMVVAIKVVKMEKFREIPKLNEFTMNEIHTLCKIENPNVVRFLEMLKTSNNMYLIYEFCNGDTLEALIQKRKFLTEPETMKLFAQMLNAFRSLVKENILHRDLKPSNILFHDNVIKIADFGFCKSLLSNYSIFNINSIYKDNTDLTQTMVGSPIYMAPEVLKGCSYNQKADVWSLGVVLYECLFGFCPFEDKSIARLIMQIDNKELAFSKNINNISKKCEELLRSMLQVDPRRRVDWTQLLQITFFEDPQTSSTALGVSSQVKQISQPLLKKQSSSNLNQPTNALQDKTNTYNQGQNQQTTYVADDKFKYLIPYQQFHQSQLALRRLIWERSKVVFISSILNLILEQNTQSSIQTQNTNLTFSQKSALLSFLLAKQVNQQCDSIKRIYEGTSENHEKMDEQTLQSNEVRSFMQTFTREADIIMGHLEYFRAEASKCLRTALLNKQNEFVGSVKQELQPQTKVDQRMFLQVCIGYCEEVLMDRLQQLSDDQQKKLLLLLNDLLEAPCVNEFFEKNVGDVNLKFNDQKYFDQMRRMNKDSLEELLKQRLNSIKFKLQK